MKKNICKYLKIMFLAITALLFSFNVSAKENKEVKVSVVVPIYNVKQYLGECLESICNQSLKEIEILCVNDGSKVMLYNKS